MWQVVLMTVHMMTGQPVGMGYEAKRTEYATLPECMKVAEARAEIIQPDAIKIGLFIKSGCAPSEKVDAIRETDKTKADKTVYRSA